MGTDLTWRFLVLIYMAIMVVVQSGNTCISQDAQDETMRLQKLSFEEIKLGKWAIVALTKPDKKMMEIEYRNKALAKYLGPYSKKHDITVLFFGESAFPAPQVEAWKKQFQGVAEVQTIDTKHLGWRNKGSGNKPYRYGYEYMCKFFALDIYDYLKDYDYYLRCDTDCIIKELNYDIFEWAEKNHLGYGYAARKLEAHKPTRNTLPLWTDKYTKRCNIRPSALMDDALSLCFNFYNNFHIGRVSFFNSPEVRHYLEAVNASGHILQNRWGDSTIQAYTVRLFMDPRQILYVPDFSYVHGSHDNRIITTKNGGRSNQLPQKLPPWTYMGEVPETH